MRERFFERVVPCRNVGRGGGGGGGGGGEGKEPVSRALEARASLYGRVRPTRSAIYIEGLPARANGTGNGDKTGRRRIDRARGSEREREGVGTARAGARERGEARQSARKGDSHFHAVNCG